MFDSVMETMIGDLGHLSILTIKKNLSFGVDSTYGEYTDKGLKSLMVWYDNNEFSWKYAMFLRAGTGIANPRLLTIGQTKLD